MKTSREPNKVSLPRAISKLGFASRSQAWGLVQNGRVKVNGQVELNPHRWVNIVSDKIEVDGVAVQKTQLRYIVLHKPKGVVTTRSDERGHKTVFELLGDEGKGIVPVGRLDKDTTGLLLFTNDNELANILASPASGVQKTYIVSLDRPLSGRDLSRLRSGVAIHLKGKTHLTRSARIERESSSTYTISITEGKNRQVRRMVEELGYNVLDLHRLSVGPLDLGELPEGEHKELTPEQRHLLKQISAAKQSRLRPHPSTYRSAKGSHARHRLSHR